MSFPHKKTATAVAKTSPLVGILVLSTLLLMGGLYLFLAGNNDTFSPAEAAAGDCDYTALLEIDHKTNITIPQGTNKMLWGSIIDGPGQDFRENCNLGQQKRRFEVDYTNDGHYDYDSQWTGCYNTDSSCVGRAVPKYRYNTPGTYTPKLKISWKDNTNGTVVREATATVTVMPVCPYGSGQGTVVNFGNKTILAGGGAASTAGPVNVNLDSGIYTLRTFSFDNHSDAGGGQGQNNERWVARFYDSQGNEIARSIPTTDIPEQTSTSQDNPLQTGFEIRGEVTSVDAFHAFVGSSSAESVMPICAAFEKTAELPEDPTCVNFIADPNPITVGQSTILDWTQANGESASINQGVGSVPLDGPQTVSPTQTTIYTLTIEGQAGTTSAQCTTTVTVNPVIPEDPTCANFIANPNPITLGESTTLDWTQANGVSASIANNNSTMVLDAPLNGPVSVSPDQTTTYELTITGEAGTTPAECTTTVTVNTPEDPTCTGARPEAPETASTDGPFMLFADGVENAESVIFRVWSRANDKDDYQEYSGQQDEDQAGTWKTTIQLENHPTTAEDVRVQVNVQLVDATGERTNCGPAGFNVIPLPPANFTITKTADEVSVMPGDTVTYTVIITNDGGSAQTVRLTDDLMLPPGGIPGGSNAMLGPIFDENTIPPGSQCVPSGTLATGGITFPDFPPGGVATVTYKRTANGSTGSASITNVAKLFACDNSQSSITPRPGLR